MLRLGDDEHGCWLWVRVQPNSRKQGFAGVVNERLKIALAAPAVDGKANRALVDFLADAFGVSRSSIAIRKGETAREKVVAVAGIDSNALLAALTRLGVELAAPTA